jgi:hypothetical protein
MMPKQKPTLTPAEAWQYETSIDSIIDQASHSTAPGNNPNPPAIPAEHVKQIEAWKETHAWPGRFDARWRELNRPDDWDA